jgi:hypothetical protein
MPKCAYCNQKATTEDAVGLPACANHAREADDYYRQQTGREPDEDTFLFCPMHSDLWQVGCQGCEACCQHHYGCSVEQKFGDTKTPEERGTRVVTLGRNPRNDCCL